MYENVIVRIELCLLGTHISTYPTISQGKTRIPGVNDGEEFELVHVSSFAKETKKKKNIHTQTPQSADHSI